MLRVLAAYMAHKCYHAKLNSRSVFRFLNLSAWRGDSAITTMNDVNVCANAVSNPNGEDRSDVKLDYHIGLLQVMDSIVAGKGRGSEDLSNSNHERLSIACMNVK
jgi:hypothetical protein